MASGFPEPLTVVTESQYAERLVLHVASAEFIPHNSEITLIFETATGNPKQKLSMIAHPQSVTHRLARSISPRKGRD